MGECIVLKDDIKMILPKHGNRFFANLELWIYLFKTTAFLHMSDKKFDACNNAR